MKIAMAAFTRRERKVKRILLKELTRMSEFKMLSYAEKQYLEKALDVDYIDEELDKMRKRVRDFRRWMPWMLLACGGIFVVGAVDLLAGGGFEPFHINLLAGPLYAAGPFFGHRALRRKMFIYEALRELSDADEIDMRLDRAARDADVLIDRLVDDVLAMEDGRPAVPEQRPSSRPSTIEPVRVRQPQSVAVDVDDSALSIAEIQGRKEAGSTILSSFD